MSRAVPKIGEYGHERRAHDAYWTDEPTIKALCENYQFPKRVWEPACGRGDIVKHLVARGHSVYSSDLNQHGFEGQELIADFLEMATVPNGAKAIITNPPFTHLDEFIDHANGLMRPRKGSVAILMQLQAAATKRRKSIINGAGFSRLVVLTRRPRWTREGEENTANPRKPFAWAIWDWGDWNMQRRGHNQYGDVVVA